MAASNSDVSKMVAIICEELDSETAALLANRLYEEVGQHSKNGSLKATLKKLHKAMEENNAE